MARGITFLECVVALRDEIGPFIEGVGYVVAHDTAEGLVFVARN